MARNNKATTTTTTINPKHQRTIENRARRQAKAYLACVVQANSAGAHQVRDHAMASETRPWFERYITPERMVRAQRQQADTIWRRHVRQHAHHALYINKLLERQANSDELMRQHDTHIMVLSQKLAERDADLNNVDLESQLEKVRERKAKFAEHVDNLGGYLAAAWEKQHALAA